jgi:hypothetical protein
MRVRRQRFRRACGSAQTSPLGTTWMASRRPETAVHIRADIAPPDGPVTSRDDDCAAHLPLAASPGKACPRLGARWERRSAARCGQTRSDPGRRVTGAMWPGVRGVPPGADLLGRDAQAARCGKPPWPPGRRCCSLTSRRRARARSAGGGGRHRGTGRRRHYRAADYAIPAGGGPGRPPSPRPPATAPRFLHRGPPASAAHPPQAMQSRAGAESLL